MIYIESLLGENQERIVPRSSTVMKELLQAPAKTCFPFTSAVDLIEALDQHLEGLSVEKGHLSAALDAVERAYAKGDLERAISRLTLLEELLDESGVFLK